MCLPAPPPPGAPPPGSPSSCRCLPPPLPSSFHGEDLEVCLLALILRARLAVTQACSRHDSHCGVCSLCLRDKAASVVSPASCFKHHMVALWRSPSSRPPLFLRLSYFPPSCHSAPKQFLSILLFLSFFLSLLTTLPLFPSIPSQPELHSDGGEERGRTRIFRLQTARNRSGTTNLHSQHTVPFPRSSFSPFNLTYCCP